MTPYDRALATLTFALFFSLAVGVAAGPSKIESVDEGVLQARDDAGNWGGPTMGITHQRGGDYWAKKIIDLGGLSEEAWARVDEVRLSASLLFLRLGL